MRSRAFLAAALILLPAMGAKANIALPLSHDGAPSSPHLTAAGLKPGVRESVTASVTIAERAGRKALAAEDVIQQAMKAAGVAGKMPGYGASDIVFAGASCRYQGRLIRRRAAGLGAMTCPAKIFAGQFRDGVPDGLGGDISLSANDAYEGEYRHGARMGLGVERDQDGFYPGQYGFVSDAQGRRIDMEILGLQDFKDAYWAGRYGSYRGPRIACTLIKGAVLEGSVLNGYGAKFDGHGRLIEQGFYRLGLLQNGSGPPC
jgi:hypothetical protein